jgi:septum formation protein
MPRLRATLVLASASPRRRELLATVGLPFSVEVSDVAEERAPGEPPVAYARRLAVAKARAVAARRAPGVLVIGADTIVVAADPPEGTVLEKPRDRADARRMIEALSGRTHEVVTAFALVDAPRGPEDVRHVVTRVTFRSLEEAEIAGYVESGEGDDKAGGYAVQGLGAGLVERVDGSYTNVVGLPVAELLVALRARGALEAWP